jgi:GlpG protein
LRQIGTLTEAGDAQRLADYLLTIGVKTQLRQAPDGWALWVIDEDRLDQARRELESFRQSPNDARFEAATRAAETIRRQSKRLDQQYQKNFRHVSDAWTRPNIRRRPLTFALIVACVVVFLLLKLHETRPRVMNALTFAAVHLERVGDQIVAYRDGIDDILHGEVWRLITPIFIHHGEIHLLFNLWALAAIGSVIEMRRNTATLAVLVFVSAIASNLGEAYYELARQGQTAAFGGMSGVVYALLGYAWMKGRFEPERGIILHPSTVQTMLLWLFLCMTGLLGPIANAAHVVGLIAGVAFGLSRL